MGPIVSRSLQEEVYQRLREFIFNRQLEAEMFTLQQLADTFGVSPMPVREALRRLEADGLVAFTHRGRLTIPYLSSKEIEDVFQIRLRLEPFAGRVAANRITPEEIKRLGNLWTELEDFADGGRWRANNAAFHRTIFNASANPRLATIIDNLWLMVEPYRRYYINDRALLKTAQAQHAEIIENLRKKDGPAVEKVLENHLSRTLDVILAGMKNTGPIAEEEA
jgi:DNA-binding GntR family transcriptional regulator